MRSHRTRNEAPADIYAVEVAANYEPHRLDLLDREGVDSVLGDIRAGRDASIFGADGRPYRISFPAIDITVYGDDDLLEVIADGAKQLSASGLPVEDQKEILQAALTEDLSEFLVAIDEYIEGALEGAEGNPSTSGATASKIPIGSGKRANLKAVATAVQRLSHDRSDRQAADALAKMSTSHRVDDMSGRIARSAYRALRAGKDEEAKASVEWLASRIRMHVEWTDEDAPILHELNPAPQAAARRLANPWPR